MHVNTLLKVLALVSLNKNQHGDLTGVPVQFSPDLEMRPKASLSIDLNNRKSLDHGDATPNIPFNLSATEHSIDSNRDNRTDLHDDGMTAVENTTLNSTATFNSTDLVGDNQANPRENEITAFEFWHEPNGIVFKPYFAEAPSDVNPKHISPKEALENVLKRMEEQTFERLHNCYLRIGEFNDYNYQKYQEIQYLSYTEKEKQAIVLKSQELKDAIMPAYVRLRVFIKATEKFRAKLTTWRDDRSPADFSRSSIYWPQPETVPEIWYLLYNTETIVMQLFTPKPPTQTFLDESTKAIRMLRVATVQMIPRSFIPVPQYNLHSNDALGRLFGTGTGPEDVPNEFEQATFSKDDYEQQVIVFYMFKYFEYKTGDLARHVTFISNKLKELEANTNEPDLIQINEQKKLLAAKLSELQHATIQMETYRTNPELINIYNAEAKAIKLLPRSKHITKLVGDHKKRVAIKKQDEALAALENAAPTDLATADGSDVDPTVELGKPLEWDKNWPWDF